LKAKGLKFTVEELKKLAEDAVSAENSDGELDEDSLDNVSGGVIIGVTIAIGEIWLYFLAGQNEDNNNLFLEVILMEKTFVIEKLNELGAIEGFNKSVETANTKEDTVAVLAKYGWEVTIDEFNNEILPVLAADDKTEFSEEDLDNVAGGLGPITGTALVLAGIWMAKGFFRGMKCK